MLFEEKKDNYLISTDKTKLNISYITISFATVIIWRSNTRYLLSNQKEKKMKVVNNITELFGNTPLVKLNKLGKRFKSICLC